jgi:hypothetical protein
MNDIARRLEDTHGSGDFAMDNTVKHNVDYEIKTATGFVAPLQPPKACPIVEDLQLLKTCPERPRRHGVIATYSDLAKATSDVQRSLMAACNEKDTEKIRKLLDDKSIDINGKSGRSGNTGLIICIVVKNFEGFQEFIRRGADVNIANTHGDRPLNIVTRGSYDLKYAEILLQQGADVNSIDGSGMLPIMDAILKDDFVLVKLLIDHGSVVKERLRGCVTSPYQLSFEHGNRALTRFLYNKSRLRLKEIH